MDAEQLTASLNGRWRGSYGTAPCPVFTHGKGRGDRNHSLGIWNGEKRVLIKCYGGCERTEVIDELKRQGVWENGHVAADHAVDRSASLDRQSRDREAARAIWNECRDPAGSIVERYMRAERGITVPLPPTLRFHPSLKHGPTGLIFPAMVAAITDNSRRIIAIHRTFLTPDGKKANVEMPKMTFATYAHCGGHIRLGRPAKDWGLAEGIETSLSAAILYHMPVWSAVAGSNMRNVDPPEGAKNIWIFADRNKAGQKYAGQAAERYSLMGYPVRILTPDAPFDDFNDLLLGRK